MSLLRMLFFFFLEQNCFIFMQAALDIQNASYFVVRFEGGGQVGDRGGLCGHPTPSKVAENFSLKAVLSWFDMLLAVLDCYCWVFGEGLLSPAKMFESCKIFFFSS